MRLGVVLMGLGAHAAASAGALEWMLDAGVRPYALCGMQSAAWASALYLAGYDARGIKAAVMQAACLGRRLLPAQRSARKLLAGKTDALCAGRRLEKLLLAQLGERMMSCSPQQGRLSDESGKKRTYRRFQHTGMPAERRRNPYASGLAFFCGSRSYGKTAVPFRDGLDGCAAFACGRCGFCLPIAAENGRTARAGHCAAEFHSP